MVEEPTESTLPEAPTSVTIRAFYKGYSVLVTRRGESGDMSTLIKESTKAIDWMEGQEHFAPDWNTTTPSKTTTRPQSSTPQAIHEHNFVLKSAGVTKTGKPYPAFWTCTVRNADGSFCKEKPPVEDDPVKF